MKHKPRTHLLIPGSLPSCGTSKELVQYAVPWELKANVTCRRCLHNIGSIERRKENEIRYGSKKAI